MQSNSSVRRSMPLIVFVHVPKTAGSTVAKVLKICRYRGRKHCENFPIRDLLVHARHGDWIAGHLSKDAFGAAFATLDRVTAYYATVRDLIAQLISHINWHLEFSRRMEVSGLGRFPGNDPINIDIKRTKFSDESSIIELIEKYANIFLNFQSSSVIGHDFKTISASEHYRRLMSYCYIAREHDLPTLYRAFGFLEIPDNVDTLHENVSRPNFDSSAFEGSKVREFLNRHHAHDFRLYEAVGEIAWPTNLEHLTRDLSFRCDEATAETFDEQRYFNANQDVIDAVRLGVVSSGLEHFNLFGRFERRLMRIGEVDPVFSREVRRLSPTLPTDSFENLLATDEQSYLRVNPDVADAVRLGSRIVSGRVHFDRYERAEGRLLRRLSQGESRPRCETS